jgi:hypothetical protein
MFNFFHRPAAATVKSAAKPKGGRPAPPPVAKPGLNRPEPTTEVVEVVEGNEDTDWALWENSVSALDSQMQSLMPSVSIHQKEPPPKPDDIDPFASVSKNAP